MAAGEGSRLRPLTERWPKPVLPIDGRPVLATLLRELAAAGVERVGGITGHRAGPGEALVGDGSAFGLEALFRGQPGVLGSADCERRGLDAGLEPPFLVSGADTVFGPGDIGRFAAAASSSGAAGALAVRREPRPDPPHRPGTRVEEGRVTKLFDDDPAAELSAAPLWAFGAALMPFLDGLSGPPYALADTFAHALEAGLEIAGIEIGATRDLTHPVDLVKENFPYLSGS